MRRSLILASLLALAGCASWFHARIPAASTDVAPEACAGIWSAAFLELQARGFKIAACDPASGTLRTETMVIPGRAPCGYVQCAYRDTIHVTVSPRGEVGVRIARELSSLSIVATPGAVIAGDRWDPPASTQRSSVAGVVADQDVLLRAILQRAATAPAAAGASSAAAAAPAPAPVASVAAQAPEPVPADAAAPQAAAASVAPTSAESPAPSPPVAMPVPSVPAPAPAVSTSPAAAPRDAAPPRRLRFIASVGYDYGFEDLLTVRYEDGSTDRLAANGGMVFSAGAAWPLVPSGEYELRATAGMKYDIVSGSNGSARYIAFPIELLAGWNVRPLRIAAGASLSLGPRVRGSGFLAPADLDLRSSLGIVGQADWVFPFRSAAGSFSVGLRYVWQKLEVSTGGRAVDASALGLAASVSL
jgi:hypothetical protein